MDSVSVPIEVVISIAVTTTLGNPPPSVLKLRMSAMGYMKPDRDPDPAVLR
ncbi:hypothetical protein GCM10027289_26630 [Tsukamurella serpentis]